MKFKFTLLPAFLFALCLQPTLSAQSDDNLQDKKRERMEQRMESKKIAFITESLDLSPTEAQKFWPLYNELDDKMKKLKVEAKNDKSRDNLSTGEARMLIEQEFQNEQAELDLKREYFKKMETALPVEKLAKLLIIEKRFKSEILNSIKQRINGKGKMKMNRNGQY